MKEGTDEMDGEFNRYIKKLKFCESDKNGVDHGCGSAEAAMHLFPGFIVFEATLKNVHQELDLRSGMALVIIWVKSGRILLDGNELKAGAVYICSTHKAEMIISDHAECNGVIIPAYRTKLQYLVSKTVLACIPDNTDMSDTIKNDISILLDKSENMGLDERSAHGKIFDYYIVNVVNDVLRDSFSGLNKQTSCQRFFSYIDRFIYSPAFRMEAMPGSLFMSRAKIYRLTKDFGGVAELMNSVRLSHAFVDILYDSAGFLSVDHMAGKYGFRSAASFRRAFKKKHGVTPGKLQKNIACSYEGGSSFCDGTSCKAWMRSFFLIGVLDD